MVAREQGERTRAGVRRALASPTSSVVIVRALSAVVAGAGADAAGYLSGLGLTAEALADIEARLPFPVVARAWELAAEAIRDPAFGLRFVERAPPGSFDVLEYATRSCATYGDALRHLGRYYRLLEDAAEITVEVDGGIARVVHRVIDPRTAAPRHGTEALIAALVRRGRRAIGDALAIHEVFFRHAAPSDLTEHRRVLRAPLRFGAAESGFTFDARWLDAPQSTADEGLHRILERQADAMLTRLPRADELQERTRWALLQLLPGRELTLGAVARALGTSRRSLQRGLAAEGVSYQELLDLVRRNLASGYLCDGTLTSAQIAFLLGFSEPRAFHRAFRRWTGTTPQAFRRNAVRSDTL
jgi:AraC-like DNA-binding protein